MRKIKVYFQRPWKFSDSPYYLYLRKDPPKDIEYVNSNEFKLVQGKRMFKFQNFLKRNIKKIIRLFPSFPNAHFTRTLKDYDLIHCAHCLSLNKKHWITDVEFVDQLWAGGKANKKHRKKILNILKRKDCKRILAWTEWSKEGILEFFPEIEKKIELVYPALPTKNFEKRKSKEITLLFSSRRFYFKGGLHALEVIDRLTKKYENVKGIIVSSVPQDVLEKYSKNKKIKFYSLLSQKELFEKIYPASDIYVYPSYTDTFGFGLTESMSFGLPIVTVDGQTRREIVEDGKTGFVIEKPEWNLKDLENLEKLKETINDIEKKVDLLIKNKKLMEEMSENALNEIRNGKFSIKERNEKLEKIYSEAAR